MQRRLQDRRARQQIRIVVWLCNFRRSIRGGILRRDQVHRFLHFLVGCGIGWVHAVRLFELRQRSLQVALSQGLFPLFEVVLPIGKAHVVRAELVLGIHGARPEGAFVMNQRRIVVLDGLGLAAGLKS